MHPPTLIFGSVDASADPRNTIPHADCPLTDMESFKYVNVGAAFCGGCQLYGTLLEAINVTIPLF